MRHFATLALAVTLWTGCSGTGQVDTGNERQPDGGGRRVDGGTPHPDAGHPVDAGSPPAYDAGHAPAGTLTIEPANEALPVQLGVPNTIQLHAVMLAAGGATTPVTNAQWSSSRTDIATIAYAGLVSASGPVGGVTVITATAWGQTATTTVSVNVGQTVYSTPASDGGSGVAIGGFSNPGVQDPVHSPAFLYPYDKTVIPVNLQPLEFQWQGGAGNDLYQLTLNGPLASLVAYVTPANPSQPSFAFAPAVWQPFAQSNIGQTITITLSALSSSAPTAVYAAPPQKLTLAASRFAGTIYYWTVSAPGQVLRISAGSTSPDVFYTPPFAPDTSDGASNDNCIACHAISHDGTRMSAELWNGFAPNSGTILDLTQTPAVPVLPAGPGGGQTWTFSAFDSTGQHLITSISGAMTLRDATTGMPTPAGSSAGNLATIGCGPGDTCTQPAWSPDESTLVYMQGVPGDFTSDVGFSKGDLMAAPWADGGFGTPTELVARDFDGRTLANLYPSISSDSQMLAFTRSSCAYDCDTADGLFVAPLKGGTPTELVQAEIGGTPTVSDGGFDYRNRYPDFSPFQEGGYQWLAFFSMRDYGWVTQGQGLRQVWVTAIDQSPDGGADPSHPAFWLPVQDPTTMNDKAEWAPLPCVGSGSGCQGDIDCCGGLVCRAEDAGSVCVPAAQACGNVGASCSGDGSCCSPLVCTNGACAIQFQ